MHQNEPPNSVPSHPIVVNTSGVGLYAGKLVLFRTAVDCLLDNPRGRLLFYDAAHPQGVALTLGNVKDLMIGE